jgi:bifunctional UDP-N-acetylglucosamine pyrophosphorylase/glucosamine-1-phosphate N-acetyltransferase
MNLSIVILAAGNGKRMKTSLPKVLHRLAGKSLLEHVFNTAKALNPQQIFIVHGNGGDKVQQALRHLDALWVRQSEQRGTGHAVQQAIPSLADNERVLVLYGDVPLISLETLKLLLQQTPENDLGILTAQFDNPAGFGRIIRDQTNRVMAIVEHKDANESQLQIREINTGIITTSAKNLKEWLPQLKAQNAQGEFYLTDIVALAVSEGVAVHTTAVTASEEVQGVNNLIELAKIERYYQLQQAQYLMAQGVTLQDPHRFDVRGELDIAADTFIDVNVILEGKVVVGEGSKIGPNCFLRNVTLGKQVEILPNCVIDGATIEDHAIVGPFARMRPGTHLAPEAKVGNFVEVKNTYIGKGSKASHLSYLGDTTIGKNVNVGAGVITCNYDGVNKHKTLIEDEVFIGSNTSLVAPVKIGEGATIGAGSTITQDAPANQLTLARSKQQSIAAWERPLTLEKK